jgi:hypothetical protein
MNSEQTKLNIIAKYVAVSLIAMQKCPELGYQLEDEEYPNQYAPDSIAR